jgi:hypothetical protein
MEVSATASARQVQAAKRNVRQARQAVLEDRNRQRLYEIAKDKNIPGRSKRGRWDVIDAIRKTRSSQHRKAGSNAREEAPTRRRREGATPVRAHQEEAEKEGRYRGREKEVAARTVGDTRKGATAKAGDYP